MQTGVGTPLQFDIRTAVILGALAALSISLLSALLWMTRRTYPGFGRWTAGNIFTAASLLFLSFRGLIPDFMSVAGTNTGALAAGVLLLEGTREFLGLPPAFWPARIFAGLSLIVQIYLVVVVDNLSARIVIVSLSVGLLTFATALTLLQGVKRGSKLSFWFAGSCFTFCAVFNFVRGFAACVPWARADLFTPTLVNEVYFGGSTLAIVGWAFAFILLTNDRLIEELAATEHRTAALNRQLAQATQRATEAARQAVLADEAKTEFLAYMSHEIRNPLSGVMVLAELVLDGPLTEEKRADLETLGKSATSVVGIIDDILDLSKIEAGRLTVTAAPFDLEAELAQVVELFSPQAAGKSTILRLTYPPGLPRWFCGDRLRVRQIAANFTSNAVKFTDHGEIELRVEQCQDYVEISVRDTGTGIPAKVLPSLFSKFTQAAAPTGGGRYRGTGLGLAISKQLAELMAGRVGTASEEGRGSTFWLQLPLKPVDEPVQLEAPSLLPGGLSFSGLRVLVAEDNPLSQQVMVKLLEKHGMAVDIAGSGREAVARYSQADYSVILMDCQMPDMDGYEATRLIRKLESGNGRRTPVIAVTANAMANERELCRAAGMDDYLVKPFTPVAMFECIASHLFRKA
jgi:signal transduction histidine kinase